MVNKHEGMLADLVRSVDRKKLVAKKKNLFLYRCRTQQQSGRMFVHQINCCLFEISKLVCGLAVKEHAWLVSQWNWLNWRELKKISTKIAEFHAGNEAALRKLT